MTTGKAAERGGAGMRTIQRLVSELSAGRSFSVTVYAIQPPHGLTCSWTMIDDQSESETDATRMERSDPRGTSAVVSGRAPRHRHPFIVPGEMRGTRTRRTAGVMGVCARRAALGGLTAGDPTVLRACASSTPKCRGPPPSCEAWLTCSTFVLLIVAHST